MKRTADTREPLVEVDPHHIQTDDPEVKPVGLEWEFGPGGWIQYDPISFEILPVGHRRPLPLPDKRFNVPQPFVATCSPPGPGNMGCASYDGCPVKKWHKQMRAKNLAPWVGIMRTPSGGEEASYCFEIYTARRGRKFTNPDARILRGWKFITNKTYLMRTRARLRVDQMTGEKSPEAFKVQEEIKRLGPMYAHLTKVVWPMKMTPPAATRSRPVPAVPYDSSAPLGEDEARVAGANMSMREALRAVQKPKPKRKKKVAKRRG